MAVPHASETTSVGTIVGERIAMSVDQSSLAHIMGVLTDLYSDPEAAVLREISTNARDAHLDAGNPAPIEVSLPTPLWPTLEIRDYGVGLDRDDINLIYSRYGASTKRDSDTVTGMFGLGCKAPLTYASQFTLIGVKNGERCKVAVSRDDSGAGSMTVLSVEPTNEPNGVAVVVPAKTVNNFEPKAARFFSVWPEGSVLVNGQAPERAEGLFVTEDLLVLPQRECLSGSQRDRVVMGGVSYPADLSLEGLHYEASAVAWVPMGAVDIPPSREAIQDTARTRATLAAIREEYQAGVHAAANRYVSEAPGHRDAVVRARDMQRLFRPRMFGASPAYTYQGEEVPTEVKSDFYDPYWTTRPHDSRAGSSSRTRQVHSGAWPTCVWVTDWTLQGFSAAHKHKLNKWAAAQGIEPHLYVLGGGGPPDLKWIDPATVVSYDTIKAIELPRAPRAARGRLSGSYDAYVAGYRACQTPASEIDTARPLYWTPHTWRSLPSWAGLVEPDATVVALPANRVNKFRRDFPTAATVKAGAEASYRQWRGALSRDVRVGLVMDTPTRRNLRWLAGVPTRDAALADAIRIARLNVDAYKLREREFAYRVDIERETWHNPLEDYPLLLTAPHTPDRRHAALYIEAVYAAREGA